MLTFDDKKTYPKPKLSHWEDCISSEIHQIISFFYEWMTIIPSFKIIIDAFDNKKSIDVLKMH